MPKPADSSRRTFELNKHEDARITQYETPATDKALEDLQYNKFWAGKYISSELTFEIFAYEFVSKDEAKVYFENETGTLEERDTFWRLSGGAFSSRLIVVDEKNAYIVHTSTAQVKAVREFLKKTLQRNWILVLFKKYQPKVNKIGLVEKIKDINRLIRVCFREAFV